MLDKGKIGHKFPPFTVRIDGARLYFFAKAIGETAPVYTSIAAARAAGYGSLPMPLTFAFCLGKEIPDPADVLTLLELDFADVLHGEQSFHYFAPACAGEVLIGQKQITDIYEKKNRTLGFVKLMTRFRRQDDTAICDAFQTVIVKRTNTA